MVERKFPDKGEDTTKTKDDAAEARRTLNSFLSHERLVILNDISSSPRGVEGDCLGGPGYLNGVFLKTGGSEK